MSEKIIKNNKKLSVKEKILEKEISDGDWTEASAELKHKFTTSAQNIVTKKNREARVNIRMTTETLGLIQDLAEQEGIGYQTLMGSVLHKFAHGLFISTEDIKKVVESLNLKKSGKLQKRIS